MRWVNLWDVWSVIICFRFWIVLQTLILIPLWHKIFFVKSWVMSWLILRKTKLPCRWTIIREFSILNNIWVSFIYRYWFLLVMEFLERGKLLSIREPRTHPWSRWSIIYWASIRTISTLDNIFIFYRYLLVLLNHNAKLSCCLFDSWWLLRTSLLFHYLKLKINIPNENNKN